MIEKYYNIVFRPTQHKLASLSQRGLVFVLWNALFSYFKFKFHFSRVMSALGGVLIYYYILVVVFLVFTYNSFGPDLEFIGWNIAWPPLGGVLGMDWHDILLAIVMGFVFLFFGLGMYSGLYYVLLTIPCIYIILIVASLESLELKTARKSKRVVSNVFAIQVITVALVQQAATEFSLGILLIFATALGLVVLKTYLVYLARHLFSAAKKEVFSFWIILNFVLLWKLSVLAAYTALSFVIFEPIVILSVIMTMSLYPIGTLSSKFDGYENFWIVRVLDRIVYENVDVYMLDGLFGDWKFDWFKEFTSEKHDFYKWIVAGVLIACVIFSSVYYDLDWQLLGAILVGIYFWGISIDRKWKVVYWAFFLFYCLAIITNPGRVVLISALYGVIYMIVTYTAAVSVNALRIVVSSHSIQLMGTKFYELLDKNDHNNL